MSGLFIVVIYAGELVCDACHTGTGCQVTNTDDPWEMKYQDASFTLMPMCTIDSEFYETV